jgi:prepilin-type N-terminal cleavage/methylation domain-containing protein
VTENPRRSGHEAGLTLIEILVTMTIMLVLFAIFAGGLGLAIFGADVNNRQATAASAIKTVAETVKAMPYEPYDSHCAVSYPLPAAPKDFSWAPETVAFWNPDSNNFESACRASGDSGLQLIKLRLTSSRPLPNSTSGQQQEVASALDVVKRNPKPNL